MRRSLLASIMAIFVLLAGTLTAHAATTISGTWTANHKGERYILHLKGSGSPYTGTYTFIGDPTAKGKLRGENTYPMTATTKVVQGLTNVTLTISFKTSKVTINCAIVKTELKCISASQQVIVFTHSA